MRRNENRKLPGQDRVADPSVVSPGLLPNHQQPIELKLGPPNCFKSGTQRRWNDRRAQEATHLNLLMRGAKTQGCIALHDLHVRTLINASPKQNHVCASIHQSSNHSSMYWRFAVHIRPCRASAIRGVWGLLQNKRLVCISELKYFRSIDYFRVDLASPLARARLVRGNGFSSDFIFEATPPPHVHLQPCLQKRLPQLPVVWQMMITSRYGRTNTAGSVFCVLHIEVPRQLTFRRPR